MRFHDAAPTAVTTTRWGTSSPTRLLASVRLTVVERAMIVACRRREPRSNRVIVATGRRLDRSSIR